MDLGDLRSAIDRLAAVDATALDDAAVHDAVLELAALQTRIDSIACGLLSAWSANKTWADDGSKSAKARLSRDTKVSPSTAHLALRRAKRLRSMPVTAEAFAAGEISADRVDLLARCNSPEHASLFARDEAVLVGHCQRLRWPDLLRVLARWRACADDATGRDPAQQQHDRRRAFAARTFGGTVEVSASMDPIGGEIWLGELERLEQHLFEQDWAEARARLGSAATSDDLQRTTAQRRHDAMVLMARRSHALGERPVASRPLLTVHWGGDAMRSLLCETANGVQLTNGHIIPLLSEADLERIVFDGASRVLDVGARSRFFEGALRRAIEARDLRCQHPSGCDIPAHRCQIDHIQPVEAGGPTVQENGRCYCPVHNRTRNRKRPPPEDP